ncbi:hypothetical protein M5U04_20220 [Xenorhabdus sp. XENO-1]|uniref:RHS repeat-associated core domain-containing protein n=1 Tax=Xenorhabdus bovienii TaxID=40576 RepID=UPI0020CA2A7E|nr:RHS repeat-associated core domain-containing protein [Xenorhabdus bovienii]MCP9270332.1 hypothetical protein [Xenorhabdus bovienii subsp. africana]
MSNNDFFTQAGNFTSTISGDVDPRTGQFNLSISLGNIIGNGRRGPELPITLSYSPLSQDNTQGFGVGVSMGLSTFDTRLGALSLSTGEQYRTFSSGDDIYVNQKKLDSFTFNRQKDKTYKIIYSSGDMEFLQGDNIGGNLKLPTRLVSASGYTLNLTQSFQRGQSRLADVSDENGVLLSVTYTDDSAVMDFYPGTPENYTITLLMDNGVLKQVTRKTEGESEPELVWKLDYRDIGAWGKRLITLTSPAGLVQSVEYRNDGGGHKFPELAPKTLSPIPYVKTFTQHTGNDQPDQITQYTYDSRNFLGGNSYVAWDAARDNLYTCPDEYKYFSTETQVSSENASTVITRTYNHYHLQISEETTCGSCSVRKDITYYADPTKSFDDQPRQFQCPTSTTTTWTDSSNKEKVLSRTEVVHTEFAESGVQTYQMDADGTETTWEYYPAEGGTDCPAEPNGFTRFTKSETVTPRSPAYGAAVHKTLYTYATVDHAGTDVSALVMKKTEKHYADDVLLTTLTCEYGKNTEKTAGVLTQKTTAYPNPADGGTTYTTTEAATFADKTLNVDGNNIAARVSTYTLTSHDRLAVTRSKTVSRMTGRLLESTDSKGVVTAYTHNSLGWLTKRVHCKGDKDYENTTTCEYSIATGGGVCATTTDQNKNKVRHEMDGMGRLLHIKKNDVDMDSTNTEPEFLMRQQIWDALGRSLASIAHDYQGAVDKTGLTVTQTLSYDDWGQVSQSVSSEGVTTHTETVLVPPLTKDISNSVWQTRSWQSGGKETSGITVTTLDNNHNPVKTEMYPKGATIGKDTAYSVTTSEYDGWSRLVSQTEASDPTNKLPPEKTTYAYDVWDRPTVTTLPDGTQTVRKYVDFSSAKLPVSISVMGSDGKPVQGVGGTQAFDGLGRLRSTVTGGRYARYLYAETHQRHPTVIFNEAGYREVYEYIKELGDVTKSLKTQGGGIPVNQDWTYNKVTAAMTSATEGTLTLNYGYAASGQPISMAAEEVDGVSKSTALNSRTIGGTAIKVTDYSGVAQTVTLDVHGRATQLDDADITSTLIYDDLGRVTQWTASNAKTGFSKTTTLTLDDYGRETQRTIATPTETLTVKQEWSKKHQVTRRTTTQTTAGNTVTLRVETYEFHKQRGWLMTYTVTDSTPPRDESGRPLSQQAFTYDAVTGNMTSKKSTFTDNRTSVTTYQYENEEDHCQLTGITTDGTVVTLTYDDAGRLTKDEQGRILSYDALGRLYEVKQGGNTLSRYRYDASNRLVAQTTGDITTHHYYANNTLSYLEDNQKNSTRLTPYAQVSKGKNAGTWLTSADMTGSVLSVTDEGTPSESYAYTPYGVRSSNTGGAGKAVTGYNGERLDVVVSQYHLGNGYRAYNPALQRFTSPDSISPFGDGGINPYIYCEGDPINRTDPTGHLFWEIALAAKRVVKAVTKAVRREGEVMGLISEAAAADEEVFGGKAGENLMTNTRAGRRLGSGAEISDEAYVSQTRGGEAHQAVRMGNMGNDTTPFHAGTRNDCSLHTIAALSGWSESETVSRLGLSTESVESISRHGMLSDDVTTALNIANNGNVEGPYQFSIDGFIAKLNEFPDQRKFALGIQRDTGIGHLVAVGRSGNSLEIYDRQVRSYLTFTESDSLRRYLVDNLGSATLRVWYSAT